MTVTNQLFLAIDSAGFPARWMDWQEAVTQEVLGKVAYGFGEHEFTFVGGKNRDSGLDSTVTLKSILVLHGVSKIAKRRTTIPLTNSSLFRRDRNMCAYCGSIQTRGLTRDHIVPLSKGGGNHWLNVCACCSDCNVRKGAQSLEDLGWQLLYLPYAPNHQEGLLLENRKILFDQMEFLRSMIPKHSRLAA
jgi:5-methylcytosine-specific restriction endonuclease McrA